MKTKSLLILLLSSIFLFTTPTQAASMPNIKHREMINGYIDQLNLIQNQVFTVAQKILFSSTTSPSSVTDDLNRISTSINAVNRSMYNYVDSLADDTPEKRDILLLLNAVNYIKSSLYELNLLATQPSPPDKLTTLERYFNYRYMHLILLDL